VDELLSVVRAEPTRPQVLVPAPVDGLLAYDTPAPEFWLAHAELTGAGIDRRRGAARGPEIVLCFAAHCRLTDGETGAGLELTRGAAALVTAQVPSYRVEGAGGRVVLAGVP
jgi:mannose-6-phosphate isomerase class I